MPKRRRCSSLTSSSVPAAIGAPTPERAYRDSTKAANLQYNRAPKRGRSAPPVFANVLATPERSFSAPPQFALSTYSSPIGTRQRRESPNPPSSSSWCSPRAHRRVLRLSTTNLERFNSGMAPSNSSPTKSVAKPGSSARTGSSSKSPASGTAQDAEKILEAYGIHIERQIAMPEQLEKRVHWVKTTAREGEISPNAEQISGSYHLTRKMSEENAMDWLVDDLTVAAAAQVKHNTQANPLVYRAKNINFPRKSVPIPEDEKELADALAKAQLPATPRPDLCFGYSTSAIGRTLSKPTPFTEAEERNLDDSTYNQLSTDLHFPFLTWQWKSSYKGGTIDKAMTQGARDGAAVVNNMYNFLTLAGRREAIEPAWTCHFSGCTDSINTALYVHWRSTDALGNTTYEMHHIADSRLSAKDDVAKFRLAVKNVVKYALSARLELIKAAITTLPSRRNVPGVVINPHPTPQPSAGEGSPTGKGERQSKRQKLDCDNTPSPRPS